jgi:hypothetical protein
LVGGVALAVYVMELVGIEVVEVLVIVRLRARPKVGVPRPKPSASRWGRAQNWAKQQWEDKQAQKRARENERWQDWEGYYGQSSSGSGSWSNWRGR